MRNPFQSARPRTARPSRSPASGGSLNALMTGNRPIILGLVALVIVITAIGVWNEKHQPQANFTLSSQDLAPDPLAPASVTPDAQPSAVTPADTPSASPEAAAPVIPSVRIVARDVNMRKAPSRQAPVVARPQLNAEFRLSGEKQQAEGIDWVQVVLDDGSMAWIGSRFVAPVTAASAVQAPHSNLPAPKDDVEAAAQVVAQLLMAPGQAWPKAPTALRQLSTRALLKQIFQDRPVTPKHAPALDACMKASSAEPKLAGLKVYELAAACALALGWR